MNILNKNKKDLYWFHNYKVVQNMNDLTSSNFPTVSMEIGEEATIEEHLYAFERFLQSIGFVLPDNSHLDFVENDIESDRDEEIIIEDPSNHKNNGTN
jgi:hypothetical protein